MKPHKTKLLRVLNILKVVSDPRSQSHVVLGHTETEGYCGTHRCVLGWYNHIFRRDDPYDFNYEKSKEQFGIDKKTYLKIFGTGSEATNSPADPEFDEDQTRREMRRRIKIIEQVLESA